MRVKRVIMSIILAFSLIAPVVSPEIVPASTSVSQAKAYDAKSVKAVRKRFNKIKRNMSLKKIKKILGGKQTKTKAKTVGDTLFSDYFWYYYVTTKKQVIAVVIRVSFIDDSPMAKEFSECYDTF